ncbi:hypothetical protein [Alkalibacterium olivapovliticus]|uniref:Uncharacterized protein n=1 Tax=Alkalibacterium olivapovliticus TaxID=99907 RepID=A0A2T0VWJ4_9LACT|nr:hypothetical protein [Alkalibacterium olivapovliticus]PRY76196.1 hypothetical protein CLV38_13227 [Alkalibacterium olivapovliticus]
MKKGKSNWNLPSVFVIATLGNISPLIRELINANWRFSAVHYSYYILIAMSFTAFFIAYQIVTNMAIPRKTLSFYLSLLGVNFLMNMILLLIVSVIMAITY